MNLISTTEVAKLKGVTRQAVVAAINRGGIDGQKVSARTMVVVANREFEHWEPNRARQSVGRSRKKRSNHEID